jgi:hypothetical protein
MMTIDFLSIPGLSVEHLKALRDIGMAGALLLMAIIGLAGLRSILNSTKDTQKHVENITKDCNYQMSSSHKAFHEEIAAMSARHAESQEAYRGQLHEITQRSFDQQAAQVEAMNRVSSNITELALFVKNSKNAGGY